MCRTSLLRQELGFFSSGFFLCSFSHNLYHLFWVKEQELQASWTQFKHAQYGESKPVEQSLMTKTDVFLSDLGGQVWTVENAAKTLVWTKNLFIRFQETENGGFRKRISVDRASECIDEET